MKKANIVGLKSSDTLSEAAVEDRLSEALQSRSVQLVELRLLKVGFSSSMKTLGWLAAAAQELAPTLKVLAVRECGVEGPIPARLGDFFPRLTVADLRENNLDGDARNSSPSMCACAFASRSNILMSEPFGR